MNTLTTERVSSKLAANSVLTPLRTPANRGNQARGTEALLSGARTEVMVMSSHCNTAREPIALVRQIDHENLRRGIRYRVLAPDSARIAPVLATQLATLALAGADVRTVPEVPTEALVIDAGLAILPAGADRCAGVTALRLPSVVTTTVELYERVWASAVPLSGSELPETGELCMRERELLSLLSVGYTDAAAAARLNISVRTVRRMVADIMNRLGARSRFQAGAKAADRGWLLEMAG